MPDQPRAACGRCGKDPADGFAMIGDTRYCHGDSHPEGRPDLTVPTCYELTGIGSEWTGPMFYDPTVTSHDQRERAGSDRMKGTR